LYKISVQGQDKSQIYGGKYAMRLTNGTNRCSGVLEVFHDGQWGVLCNRNWPPNLATTMCDQLDCGRPKKTDVTFQNYRGYMSSCPGNATSISECTLTKNSDVCQGIALSCLKEIRLMNGSDRCSGRVEVYFHKQWGTVCDDNWDMADAQVVCRAMDCGVALDIKPHSFFGGGEGDIWLDNVECAGNESTLTQCAHNPIGDHNCGHGEDTGVICSCKLLNGTTSCSGRVEFSVDGQWSSASRSSWGTNEAKVTCREMDCGEATSFSGTNSANEPSRMYDVSCTGTETSLKKCTIKKHNKTSGGVAEDATVVCTGKTLLSEGPNRCAGRVEVFHNGQWADVCTDIWDINDAQVVCKQLNCGSPHKVITVSGRAGQSLWANQTICNGREMGLSFCLQQFTNQSCASPTVAGVICSDGLVVRLSNGQDRCSGRVEVLHGNKWGTVCDSDWNQNKAKAVCDLLECGHVMNVSTGRTYPAGVGPVFDASDACFHSVESVHQCSFNGFPSSTCRHDKDIGIVCDSSIRLVNGTDRCSGRVEILYQAKWGTVCDDDWDILDAQVVCRSRDCGSAMMAVPGAFFGEGAGNVWLDDVACLGNESSLVNCSHPDLGNNNCGHGEDAGVICSSKSYGLNFLFPSNHESDRKCINNITNNFSFSGHLRLFGGPHQCSGNVEVYYDGEWLPALNTKWGMNEAAVVCREMGCGDPKTVSGSFTQREVQRGFKVSCTGREHSVSMCTVIAYTKLSTDQLKYAAVTCSGIVKLVDGPNRCAGRLEVFHKGQWGDVCGQSWDMNDAHVVCQQLNCGTAFKLTTDPSHYGRGRSGFNVEHIECNGRESLLQQCTVTHGGKECNSSSVAAVIVTCDSLNIRLVGGADRCTGRVEVRMGSVWGSVCAADWTVEKAETVCEVLECGQAVNVSSVPHKTASPMSDPAQTCFSNTQSLKQCLNNGLPRATCAQDNDASLVCISDFFFLFFFYISAFCYKKVFGMCFIACMVQITFLKNTITLIIIVGSLQSFKFAASATKLCHQYYITKHIEL
uniref:Soluble scavenger receptor cysteine-rich domain-containing protein SSC5D n=1 Tax=Periophthalmus magnuspinnatus TaxID=409849 RepID=A0A3B4BDF7_9GOBI